MVWVKISDDIDEHPKIAALSDSAFALLVCSLAYSNRNLTDGFVPSAIGLGKLRYCEGNTIPPIRELEASGLWKKIEGGWLVHDYHDYQPTREAVLRERGQTRERVRRHRNADRNSVTEGVGNASGNGQVTPAPVPVPVPVPEPVPKDLEAFDQFWTIYPRQVGKPTAKRAFLSALKEATVEEILVGAKRYAEDPEREPRYTAHPTTWLHRAGWNDPSIPPEEPKKRRPDPPRAMTDGDMREYLDRELGEDEDDA